MQIWTGSELSESLSLPQNSVSSLFRNSTIAAKNITKVISIIILEAITFAIIAKTLFILLEKDPKNITKTVVSGNVL